MNSGPSRLACYGQTNAGTASFTGLPAALVAGLAYCWTRPAQNTRRRGPSEQDLPFASQLQLPHVGGRRAGFQRRNMDAAHGAGLAGPHAAHAQQCNRGGYRYGTAVRPAGGIAAAHGVCRRPPRPPQTAYRNAVYPRACSRWGLACSRLPGSCSFGTSIFLRLRSAALPRLMHLRARRSCRTSSSSPIFRTPLHSTQPRSMRRVSSGPPSPAC